MCDLNKILKNHIEFCDLYYHRTKSDLDYMLYRNYVMFLYHKCKCEIKFKIDDWL